MMFCAVQCAGESSFEVKTEADHTEHTQDDKPYLVETGKTILELSRDFFTILNTQHYNSTVCRHCVSVCRSICHKPVFYPD